VQRYGVSSIVTPGRTRGVTRGRHGLTARQRTVNTRRDPGGIRCRRGRILAVQPRPCSGYAASSAGRSISSSRTRRDADSSSPPSPSPVPVPVPPYGWQSGHVMCRPPVPPPPAGYIIRHLHRRVRAPSSSSSIDRHLSLGLQSSPKINKPAAESISGMQAVGIIRRGLTIDPAGEEDRTHDDMRRPLL